MMTPRRRKPQRRLELQERRRAACVRCRGRRFRAAIGRLGLFSARETLKAKLQPLQSGCEISRVHRLPFLRGAH